MNADRFWSRVFRDVEGCWPWRGNIATHGYGRVWWEGRRWRVHRLAYVLTYGSIPCGMCVLHRCDARACVNPQHLWLGTTVENTRDMMVKGRGVRLVGEQKGTAKLSE